MRTHPRVPLLTRRGLSKGIDFGHGFRSTLPRDIGIVIGSPQVSKGCFACPPVQVRHRFLKRTPLLGRLVVRWALLCARIRHLPSLSEVGSRGDDRNRTADHQAMELRSVSGCCAYSKLTLYLGFTAPVTMLIILLIRSIRLGTQRLWKSFMISVIHVHERNRFDSRRRSYESALLAGL